MITEDLILYIQEQRRKNISDTMINLRLTNAGWHSDDVAEAFRKLAPIVSPVSKPKPPIPALTPTTPYIAKEKLEKDLYRESPRIKDEPKVIIEKPKTPVFVPKARPETRLEVRSEELMPALVPKAPQTSTPSSTIPRVSSLPQEERAVSNFSEPRTPSKIVDNLPKGAILHSYQQALSSMTEANRALSNRTKNTLRKVLVAVVIIIVLGGITFAFTQGYIKLPSINIPFIKKDPKLLLQKAPMVLDGLKSYKIETTAVISMPLVADITSGLWSGQSVSSLDRDFISLSAKGIVNNIKPTPVFDYQATIQSSLLPDTLVADLKYAEGTSFVTIPDLSSVLGPNAPDASVVSLPEMSFDSLATFLPTFMQNIIRKVNADKFLSTIVPSYVSSEIASILKDFVISGDIVEKEPEDIRGELAYHYELVASRQATKEFLQKFVAAFTINISAEEKANLDSKLGSITMDSFEIWIGKNDSNIHQYKFTLTAPLSKVIGLEDKGIAGSDVSLSFQTSYYDFDVPNIVILPTSSISLNDFAMRIHDMKIKNSISSFKSIAGNLRNNLGNYGKRSNPTGSCTNPNLGSLFSPVGHTKGASASVGAIAGLMTELLTTTNGALSCYSTPGAWALSAPLASDPAQSFCADSTGAILTLASPLAGTVCK